MMSILNLFNNLKQSDVTEIISILAYSLFYVVECVLQRVELERRPPPTLVMFDKLEFSSIVEFFFLVVSLYSLSFVIECVIRRFERRRRLGH
ncbi:unnamed protein product [Caenorhabditis nigoni]